MDKAIAILKWLGNYDAEEALAELTEFTQMVVQNAIGIQIPN